MSAKKSKGVNAAVDSPEKVDKTSVSSESRAGISDVGNWIDLDLSLVNRNKSYLVGCSRTKKWLQAEHVSGRWVTSRGVILNWVPDKILVVPQL